MSKKSGSELFANLITSLGGWTAAFLSYFKWHSIWWAILHFLLGWIYVAYRVVEKFQ